MIFELSLYSIKFRESVQVNCVTRISVSAVSPIANVSDYADNSQMQFAAIRYLCAAILFVGVSGTTALAAEDGMVGIPGGHFTMGSDHGLSDEGPAHTVELPAFLIDRVPVTNARFVEFLNARGWRDANGRRYYDIDDGDARIHRHNGRFTADTGFGDHAVNESSWLGALEYCRSKGKRLPTEAEWERAARGALGREFPWGDETPSARHARFAFGWNETAPVGTYPVGATPEGVLDLAGNVHEWTSSRYRPYPYRPDDGREVPDPDVPGERVTRGGGHDSPAEELRAAWRGDGVSRNPRAGHRNIGFRCAKNIPRA
jgi:formylglycine-generating enzyme required for sulfatase activity